MAAARTADLGYYHQHTKTFGILLLAGITIGLNFLIPAFVIPALCCVFDINNSAFMKWYFHKILLINRYQIPFLRTCLKCIYYNSQLSKCIVQPFSIFWLVSN